jgi:hypothetical protein
MARRRPGAARRTASPRWVSSVTTRQPRSVGWISQAWCPTAPSPRPVHARRWGGSSSVTSVVTGAPKVIQEKRDPRPSTGHGPSSGRTRHAFA